MLVTLVDVKELVVELDGEELDVGLARLALLLGPTGECFINMCVLKCNSPTKFNLIKYTSFFNVHVM